MIKSVTVKNHIGESLKLELGSPEKTGLSIRQITGLGPCTANINMSEIATLDGSVYNSARVNTRNIVITLGMMFKPTIEAARLKVYRYFPIKQKISVIIETDARFVETIGYVESNEPNIFSNDETTQISIICPDPYFYVVGDGTSVIFSGVEPMFEFPFSNESTSEKLLVMSEKKDSYSEVINYDGDGDIGVKITIHALDTARNITIYNTELRESMVINTDKIQAITGEAFKALDDIIISTIPGNRSIYLLRGGQYTNILNCVTKDSDWFRLRKGINVFAYMAEEGQDNLEFRVDYRTAYEGV